MKELSPAERCRKNKWKKGTLIVNNIKEIWKITGLGEYEVLGKQVDLEPAITCLEEVIPFSKGIWKKSIKK